MTVSHFDPQICSSPQLRTHDSCKWLLANTRNVWLVVVLGTRHALPDVPAKGRPGHMPTGAAPQFRVSKTPDPLAEGRVSMDAARPARGIKRVAKVKYMSSKFVICRSFAVYTYICPPKSIRLLLYTYITYILLCGNCVDRHVRTNNHTYRTVHTNPPTPLVGAGVLLGLLSSAAYANSSARVFFFRACAAMVGLQGHWGERFGGTFLDDF